MYKETFSFECYFCATFSSRTSTPAKNEATRVESYENRMFKSCCVCVCFGGQRRIPAEKEVSNNLNKAPSCFTCASFSFDKLHCTTLSLVAPAVRFFPLFAASLRHKEAFEICAGISQRARVHGRSSPAPAPFKVRARETDRAHQIDPKRAPRRLSHSFFAAAVVQCTVLHHPREDSTRTSPPSVAASTK